jgi:hypothetical protein
MNEERIKNIKQQIKLLEEECKRLIYEGLLEKYGLSDGQIVTFRDGKKAMVTQPYGSSFLEALLLKKDGTCSKITRCIYSKEHLI